LGEENFVEENSGGFMRLENDEKGV